MKKVLGVALTSMVVLSGCSTMHDVDAIAETDFVMTSSMLDGKKFDLTHIDGKKLPESIHATMEFKDDRISGRGFCNLYSGAYEINYQNMFETSKMFSTKRACQDELVLKSEKRLTELLEEQMYFSVTSSGYKVVSDEGSFQISEKTASTKK